MYESYPSEEEIRRAVKICCGRCCFACETPVEYAWRRRKKDLADILSLAIDRELTERERDVIKDYYFNDMSAEEIARKRGISRAAANAAKKRAEQKLRKALCYLKIYLSGSDEATEDDIRIDSEAAILAARRMKGGDTGIRIAKLRKERALSYGAASRMTGISIKRMMKIEGGEALPDAGEIRKICALYSVPYAQVLG